MMIACTKRGKATTDPSKMIRMYSKITIDSDEALVGQITRTCHAFYFAFDVALLVVII